METLLEQFLDNYLNGIYGEGKRILRIQALSVSLKALQGTRKLLILHYIINIFCFIWALSFFAGVSFFFYRFSEQGGQWSWALWKHPVLYVDGGFWVVASFTLWFTIREKHWVNAFGLKQELDKALGTSPDKQLATAGVDPAMIAALVEEIIDRKFEKMARASEPPSSPRREKKPKAA